MKRSCILLSVLLLFILKNYAPPSESLKEQAAAFLGLEEKRIETIGQLTALSQQRISVSVGR